MKYQTENHVATKTVEELMKATGHLKGGHCKNLMMKAKGGKKSKTRNHDTGTFCGRFNI